MNKTKAFWGLVGLSLLVGFGIKTLMDNQVTLRTAEKTKYAQSYEAHGLTDPFLLLSKTYENGTVSYFYQSTLPPDATYTLLRQQLTGNGYQVQANHPDKPNIIYRDLITGGISVKAIVGTTASGRTSVIVHVTGIGK